MVRQDDLESSFVTLLYITGLYPEYMLEFEKQFKGLLSFEQFLDTTPPENWVMAIRCSTKYIKYWSELDIRWQIYHKGLIK